MQLFHIDQQTLDDLEVFEKGSNIKSIFSCFDITETIGGRDVLIEIFKNPITDLEELKNRQEIIKNLQDEGINFNFKKETLDYIEFYLRQNDRPQTYSPIKAIENSFKYFFWPDHDYYLKQRGASELLDVLVFFKSYLSGLNSESSQSIFKRMETLINTILSNVVIHQCANKRPKALTRLEIEKCDFAIRNAEINKVKELITIIYQLDAFNAVAEVSKKRNLVFPTFDRSGWSGVKLAGIFHLFLDRPVCNDIVIDNEKNVSFITGVNMSGKSTIIKSVAVAVYLGHLGFPVPASAMEMSLFNGLLTTINLSDDLNNGRSHFYNEVLRVKSIIEKINNTSNMLVIFDELFRGTNVKDAYESSLSIVDAFSKINDSYFIISTHIVEVAEQLKANKKISFYYLETIIENDRPIFNHKLQSGITADRIGLWMLKNEGIFEMLQKKIDAAN